MAQAQRIMDEIKRQNEAFQKLKSDFSQISIVRDMVASSRPRGSYPDHVLELLDIGGSPPFFFLNGKLVHSGTFPEYEELRRIVTSTLQR